MANTYPTQQFPLGSTEVKVLFNNASNFDDAMNSELPSFYDRFNKRRETWAGMQKMVADFIEAMGFEATHLVYVDGTPLTVLRPTQLIDRAGSVYKVKMPASFPVNLTGNWATDQLLLVDVGDASLRMSLALTTGANLVGFDLSNSYSPDTVGLQLLKANPKRVSAATYGIFPDTGLPMNAQVQAAIDDGAAIEIPEGEYLFSLSDTITLEAGPTWCALEFKGNACFYGAGRGRTVFKLRDGESTDVSPKFYNLMAANTVLDYVTIQGITFDLNGQNNPISPSRGSGIYNPYNCAALMVSGSVATGGFDARISHSKILDCEFINSAGVTCIALGQRFSHSGVKGEDVEIAGCRFYNNGIDSADHSSVYAFANFVDVHDNVFDHPVPSTGKGGPVCCIESFGSHNKLHNNTVFNYLQFCWVGAGEEGEHHDIAVFGNQGEVSYRFLDTWSFSPQNDGIADLLVTGNRITMTAAALGTPGLDRVAVNLNMNDADMFRIKVTGNLFHCLDRSSNVGIVVSADTGQLIADVDISNNTIEGYSRAVAGGGNGQIFDVRVYGNSIKNCHVTTARPADTRGIDFFGTNAFSTLFIYDNAISGGDLEANPAVGISVVGSLASLHMEGNAIRATLELADTVVVSGRRTGQQARYFTATPTQSTWVNGDRITNPVVTELGTTPDKYIIDGWACVSPGSGVSATWLQQRTFTGN